MSPTTDRIEKQITLRAPLARVWRALTDAREFGAWFGVKLDGEFAEGKAMRGTFGEGLSAENIVRFQEKLGLTPGTVRLPEPNAVFCTIERIEPERYFSFRWIPFGIDGDADPANEPTTLVEFRLEALAGGRETRLSIVESGFDRVPAHRRERAFRMNDAGWGAQAENIKKHVEGV